MHLISLLASYFKSVSIYFSDSDVIYPLVCFVVCPQVLGQQQRQPQDYRRWNLSLLGKEAQVFVTQRILKILLLGVVTALRQDALFHPGKNVILILINFYKECHYADFNKEPNSSRKETSPRFGINKVAAFVDFNSWDTRIKLRLS